MAFDDMVANWPQQAVTASPADAPPDTPPPGILARSWGSLADAAKYVGGEIVNPTPAADTGEPPGVGKSLGEGIVRGVHDVADAPSTWLLRQFGLGDTATQRTADEAQKFHDQYGDSTAAGIGRVAGQTIATAPIMSGAGALIGRGTSMLPGAAGRAAQFLAGSAPADSMIGRGAQLALQGTGSGAAQAGLTSSASADQPISDQLVTGGLVGGVAGPALGGLTKAIDVLRGYAGGVDPAVASLAQQARDLGIDIPIARLSRNPLLRYAGEVSAKLPFGGGTEAALDAQREAQTVIASTMGSNANNLGPAVMKEASDRIGAGYNSALDKIGPITGGAPLASDLTDVASRAGQFTDPATVGHVGRAIQQVSDTFANGPIEPEAYRALTNSTGALRQIENAAPSAAQPYLGDIRDALKARLYDAAPDGVADDLRNLDSQYRAMMTIKPLADKSTIGDIQLGGLQGQVIRQSNKYDSGANQKAFTGGGTLGTVGDIGKQFFGTLPESGTAPRMETYDFIKHPVATAAAAVPGLALNMPLQALLRRPAVEQRIINTSLGGTTPNIGRAVPYGLLGPIDYARGLQGEQPNQ